SLSFDEVVVDASKAGALVIPAHIDRPSYSVLANLGFLPTLPYTAVEMVNPTAQAWTVITASDAHFLEEVGKRSCILEMEEIGWEALKRSLGEQRNVRF
ncbi:MAG: histidinol-phosphatase, partial [Sphaerochaeta sp.]|nr:histidinol-phosphatase [Sphaerochaeta sp.]